MAIWLFQGNPRLWPVLDVLAAGTPIESWSAVRSVDRIEPGDGALLWVSGPAAGVYAVGTVTGVPEPGGEWGHSGSRSRARWTIPLRLDRLPAPVYRQELRADPRFAGAAILRQPRSGNPFPVTQQEWTAVAERLP